MNYSFFLLKKYFLKGAGGPLTWSTNQVNLTMTTSMSKVISDEILLEDLVYKYRAIFMRLRITHEKQGLLREEGGL